MRQKSAGYSIKWKEKDKDFTRYLFSYPHLLTQQLNQWFVKILICTLQNDEIVFWFSIFVLDNKLLSLKRKGPKVIPWECPFEEG